MSLFKKGYGAVREEKQRQDENREKMRKQLWRFFLSKDGDEATVRFLTEEPINFSEHTVKTVRGGKEKFDTVICTHDIGECSLCDSGDKPNFRGAYLIYDKRPFEYTDKQSGKKKTGKGQVKLYVQGARVLSQLDRLSERYGLTNRDYTITRTGSGTSTTYMFDRGDDTSKLTEAEITNMLPEKLREMYDGTMESLYGIVQNQLEMMISGYDSDDNDDDEEDDNTGKNLVGIDDEDDDEDDTSERNLVGIDDDEDDRPRKSSSLKTGAKKPMFKSAGSKRRKK